MYSKLSYFFLLVGLISQTIAASHLENEFADSIISDESAIPSFTGSAEGTTNFNDNFEKATSSFETTEEITDSIDRAHDAHVWMYLQRCLARGNSSIFDLDLVQSINEQITEPSNHVDDSQLSDDTKKEMEAIFDSIIYAMNNTDDSEISESINRATESIVYIISSAKRSDLKQIIRTIAKSSKKFMGVLMTYNKDVSELTQSMNNKIITSTILKENTSVSTYLLDLLLSIMRVIDRYEEQDEFNEVVGALSSILEQAKRDIEQSQISNDTEIVQPLFQAIVYLTDEISYLFGTAMSRQGKFSVVRCMAEDSVMRMFTRIFMTKFHSEIDS